jgi:hypothetical protein
VKETLDRGFTLERPGFIPEIQDPFSPNTSQRIYDLVRRSLTSRRKTGQAVATELSLDISIKKMRR